MVPGACIAVHLASALRRSVIRHRKGSWPDKRLKEVPDFASGNSSKTESFTVSNITSMTLCSTRGEVVPGCTRSRRMAVVRVNDGERGFIRTGVCSDEIVKPRQNALLRREATVVGSVHQEVHRIAHTCTASG